MGMSSTRFGRPEITRVGPAVAYPMHVVGVGLDIIVSIRVKVLTSLPLVPGTLNNMVHVRNHAYRDERMPIIVEINTPGIAATLGKNLKGMPGRVVAPHARIDLSPLIIGRTRLAYIGMRKYPVDTIQPAIGPPTQAVEYLMRILRTPAIE